MSTTLPAVTRYLTEGWSVLPIPKGEKGPRVPNWQHTTFTLTDFKPGDNIGVRLGEPSKGLTDIDLDSAIAIAVAPFLLLKTARIHGRPSKPNSHYWYIAAGLKSEQFKDLNDAVLVEIRSTGGQTVLPPSTHPSGEVLAWEIDRAPNAVDPEGLRASVLTVAVAALLVQHWPGAGSRHAAAGLVAGFLLSLKVAPEVVAPLIEIVARTAGDDDVADRVAFARDTVAKFVAGAPTTGGPKLSDLIGAEVVTRIRGWYGTNLSRIEELNEKHAVLFNQSGALVILTEAVEDGLPQLRFSMPYTMPLLYPELVPVGPVNAKGKAPQRKLGVVWLDHPQRRQYCGIEMAPNGRANPGYYNMWRGFAVEPKQGSWSLFHEHLQLMANGNVEHAEYILAWLAETVQHPDRPIGIALSFKGDQGTGKSTFAKWFGALFGTHFMHLDSEQRLLGHFNAHLHNAIVVLADEAVWAGGKAGLGALKRIITEDTLVIERKGIDPIIVRNMLHVLVASNESWFVPVGFDNRRFAAFEVSKARQNSAAFFGAVQKQLFQRGGLAALLYDLLAYPEGKVDLRQIPNTEELGQQKYNSMHPRDAWWYECLIDGGLWLEADDTLPGEQYKVNPDEVYNDYIAAVNKSTRVALNLGMKGALGRYFRQVMPEPYPIISRVWGENKRWWIIPSLQRCRDFFTQKYGYEKWPTAAGHAELRALPLKTDEM